MVQRQLIISQRVRQKKLMTLPWKNERAALPIFMLFCQFLPMTKMMMHRSKLLQPSFIATVM